MVNLSNGKEVGIFERKITKEEAEYLERFREMARDIYEARVGDLVRGKTWSKVTKGVITKIEGSQITVREEKELITDDRDNLILIPVWKKDVET